MSVRMIVLFTALLACPDGLDMPIGHPSNYEPDVVEDEPGVLIYDEEIPTSPESVIFVVDISGSMNGDARAYTALDGSTAYGSRLDRAKTELVKAVSALACGFEFNVFAFG